MVPKDVTLTNEERIVLLRMYNNPLVTEDTTHKQHAKMQHLLGVLADHKAGRGGPLPNIYLGFRTKWITAWTRKEVLTRPSKKGRPAWPLSGEYGDAAKNMFKLQGPPPTDILYARLVLSRDLELDAPLRIGVEAGSKAANKLVEELDARIERGLEALTQKSFYRMIKISRKEPTEDSSAPVQATDEPDDQVDHETESDIYDRLLEVTERNEVTAAWLEAVGALQGERLAAIERQIAQLLLWAQPEEACAHKAHHSTAAGIICSSCKKILTKKDLFG